MPSPGALSDERQAEQDESAGVDSGAAAVCRAPSSERPCWHRPDGQRVSFQKVLSALEPANAEQAGRQHAQAISALVASALSEQQGGHGARVRERALAASRLCQEIVGFWPSDLPDLH